MKLACIEDKLESGTWLCDCAKCTELVKQAPGSTEFVLKCTEGRGCVSRLIAERYDFDFDVIATKARLGAVREIWVA